MPLARSAGAASSRDSLRERERSKWQVTLRIDPDVIDRFREGGPGWQWRINAALRRQ